MLPAILFFVCPSAGKLTDMHGSALCYDANVKHMNSAGVLATLRNHQYYASRVPQSVLQALKPWLINLLYHALSKNKLV